MKLDILQKEAGETIREYALRVLHSNLLSMNLVPGTALSEQEIGNALKTSRTPVREACIRLAQEGVLTIFPQKGTYVAKIDLEQVSESIFLRDTMEHAIMQIACKEFSQEDLYSLQDCLYMQQLCLQRKDNIRFFELDGRFHGIIFTGCGKGRIWQMIERMSLNYNRVRMLSLLNGSYEMEKLFGQHQTIFAAIASKNESSGNVVMSEHIDKVMRDMEELKKKYPAYFKK